ncbi:PREDICTED: extracellular matrix-binding protein EbhA-like isoform X1 [Polistes canadensis]|uniref:extracellular matrix-binding protein EbhA-like isoform X1 n=1 Tax=Polistes canadensis TaxID=91411 RepID=UPI000718EB39|nr:PREDICTED: extracellular matrix-binding protein EbhA-like isoform X1 [Polistes canadensis]XP_014612399.1 PREDICTED: extracellular matrix-binding protein EbhA-like isoform X1 [Polistes canadensis]
MTSLCDAHDYYKKMLELQSKLRKSEEERIRLEERFNLLVQESRNRRDTCISRLRMKYIEFLEEQRIRDERNHKLLGALDRVDNSLSLMTAKTEKLHLFRKQYETYLLRNYANRPNPGSITGDSGVTSHIDEGYSKKSIVQSNHQVNPNIHFSTIQLNTKMRDNPSRSEQLLHVQSSPRTRIVSSSNTLYHKINVPHRSSEYERNANSPRDVKNINQRLQLPQMLSQINQPDQSSLNLENNDYFQAQYLPASILENVALNRSLISQYNKLSTSHMEPNQNVTRLAVNEASINENILHRNSMNVPLNQIPSTFTQHRSNLPMTQHTLYRDTDLNKNIPRSANFRNIASISSLGSVPRKILKADSPRRMPIEVSPRSFKQIDYFSTYKPTGYSYDNLKSKDIPTEYLPRDNSLYRNVPNLSNISLGRKMHGLSNIPKKNSDLDEEIRTTRKLENELDRYIDKIHNLHRELDVQSLDEHDYEQNTSGDLLNITLSDDGIDYPTDKVKDERASQEVAKVLALADELASKKPIVKEIELSPDDKDKEINGAVPKNDRNTNLNSETRYDVLSDQTLETSAQLEKDDINNDVASHDLELEQVDQNIQGLENENWNNTKVKNTRDPNENEKTILQNSADIKVENSKTVVKGQKEDNALQKGEELEILEQFVNAEYLNPWEIQSMTKQILEIQLDDTNKNDNDNETVIVTEDDHEKQITETLVIEENETAQPENIIVEEIDPIEQQDMNKVSEIIMNSEDFHENNKIQEEIEDIPVKNDYLEYSKQPYEGEIADTKIEVIEEENNQIIDDNQQEQLQQQNTSDEYYASGEQNIQEFDQEVTYKSEVNEEFIDPNQQYNYDQNALDEDNINQEYESPITYQNVNPEYESSIADENAIKTQEEYQEQYEEYQGQESGQEYVEENPEYREDNVYDENYDNNQINDNVTNEEYLEEQYTTVQTVQDPINTETNYNVDNTEAQDVIDNVENNEVEKESIDQSNVVSDHDQKSIPVEQTNQSKKKKDFINSLLDSDTESTIERNVSNTESDFDFQ